MNSAAINQKRDLGITTQFSVGRAATIVVEWAFQRGDRGPPRDSRLESRPSTLKDQAGQQFSIDLDQEINVSFGHPGGKP